MQQPTIRLLTLNDASSEAERLVSMLQNAGRSVRATHAESEEALSKLLLEKVWDMLIAHEETQNVPPVSAIKTIRQQNKDIPVILLTDREETQACVEGMKIGAKDVVRIDDDQHLLLVIERELNNRSDREARRSTERRFNDIVHRNQQLLDSSRDSIAFLQDGMFLYANESFAELLNYDDKDDLECLPVIDIVDPDHHESLKDFIKNFTLKVDETETKNLDLDLIRQDEQSVSVNFEVRKAIYDDESAIQLIHRYRGKDTAELEAKIEEIKNIDTQTGLYNKSFLLEKVKHAIHKAVSNEFNSALFHIGVDNFQSTVSEKIGVGAVDKTLEKIGEFTQTQVKKTDILCRFADDSFIVLVSKINAVRALERAKELSKELRDHVVEIEDKTLHFNYHVGISVINETSTNVDIPIDQSIQALQKARQVSESDPNTTVAIFEPEVESDPDKQVLLSIENALNNGDFKLLFQPILSLRGADTEHYEVLLRMLDENNEQVAPKEFLAHAASIGAMTRIDRWVILEATKTLAEHRKNGHDTQLIIHLSKDSILDEGLIAWLSVVFKTAKLPTDSLIFQLNEVDINDHLNQAKTFVSAAREIGCSVSVNHFGCALNPFKLLDEVEANYIKIDGSFTQDLQNNEEGVQSLNNLVSQLHQKEKITIVPFVENASLLSKLWQSGVHYIQGYYLQEPTGSMDYDFDMES